MLGGTFVANMSLSPKLLGLYPWFGPQKHQRQKGSSDWDIQASHALLGCRVRLFLL